MEESASKCPRCAQELLEAGEEGRYLKCQKCGFIFDTFLSREAQSIEEENEGSTRVVDSFKYRGEREFEGKAQVLSLSQPEARYCKFEFSHNANEECPLPNCQLQTKIQVDVEVEGAASAFATYFDTNDPLSLLRTYLETFPNPVCSAWRKNVNYEGSNERAVARGILAQLDGREGRCWFVSSDKSDLTKQPNWIIAAGRLCKGERGRIGILIQSFQSESEVSRPSPEETSAAKRLLKDTPEALERIARVLANKSQLKGRDIAKGFKADLLTIASPVWVKTPEGEPELGITSVELGPTTTAKSQREKVLIRWLGAGKYLSGKQTEAGITAGLEKVEGIGWVLKKGALPSSDLSFLIIDNVPGHALDTQIESRRDGIIKVSGIKSGELWGRTRLKLLSNPVTDFSELVYKGMALRELFDPKLIARTTFAIYTYAVSPDERYDPTMKKTTEDDEILLRAAFTVLRDNLSREAVLEVPEEIWPEIMKRSKELEEVYGSETIPLYVRNLPYKVSLLAYSFALLQGVQPGIEEVDKATKWLGACGRELELDKYKEDMKEVNDLPDEEYQRVAGTLAERINSDVARKGGGITASHIFKALDHLVKHEKTQRNDLEAALELDKSTISDLMSALKGPGLLRSSKDGYGFTAKGVKFVRRWLPEVKVLSFEEFVAKYGLGPIKSSDKSDKSPGTGSQATGATNQTTLEGQGHNSEARPE